WIRPSEGRLARLWERVRRRPGRCRVTTARRVIRPNHGYRSANRWFSFVRSGRRPVANYGYTLSSEEHPPKALVEHAAHAEELGFDFVSISDHYHPWTSAQGHSPFVWSVLGAIASATDQIQVGVGVTCPIMRIHPVVLAQATA